MRKTFIESGKGITKEQFEIIAKCRIDPFFFSTFIYVIHPVQGRVPFNLYDYQKSVLYHFLRNRFNIVLKFRQAGLTELISMYCLWFAMYYPNKNVQIISIKDRVAKRVLRRIKYMYRNLPHFLKLKVINGRTNDIGCVTEDTIIVGDNRDFTIGDITPKEKGIEDISHLGLKVLTHDGSFENILKVINKGQLETWEIENEQGKKIKCTWNHKLYTTFGWKTVKEILDNNLDCIFWKTDYLDDIKSLITIPPEKEIIKETRFKGYYVSNLGYVYTTNFLKRQSPGKLYKMALQEHGHLRVKIKGYGKKKLYSVHRLIWETFNGEIPTDKVIDHKDNNKTHNYITNLQCISLSENTKRSYKSNRITVNNNYRLTAVGLKDLGKIKVRDKELGDKYGTGSIISKELGLTTKEVSGYRRGLRGNYIYTSKIKRIGITKEIIVDMEVENSHSYITKSEYVNHNTGTEIEFSNGSTITSIPTTEDAGRSEAVSLLVIDEAAIVRWATQIWAAALPTLSTGGAAILNSTPYGVGNFYHKQWVDATAGGNEFFPIRLWWRMHPERDDEWYRIMSSALGPRRTAQEIDGDFLTSGNSVFDLTEIKAIEDGLSELEIHRVYMDGNLVQVRLPEKEEKYYIGADVATGRARDYSAFSIMNRAGEEVLYFKGKIPVSQLGELIMKWGKIYNNALVAPESNDIGLAVTTKIQESGYPNLFYTTKFLKEKGERKPKKSKLPGWYTDKKTRPIIIDELEEDIREENCLITNRFFIQEAYTFIYDERNRPVAMGKHSRGTEEEDILDDENTYTDDSIMAESITNFIRKGKVTTTVVAPI